MAADMFTKSIPNPQKWCEARKSINVFSSMEDLHDAVRASRPATAAFAPSLVQPRISTAFGSVSVAFHVFSKSDLFCPSSDLQEEEPADSGVVELPIADPESCLVYDTLFRDKHTQGFANGNMSSHSDESQILTRQISDVSFQCPKCSRPTAGGQLV